MSAPSRLASVDIARFLALVGMMGAHLVMPASTLWGASPSQATSAADAITPFVNGNASTLFAVIGGMSMVLASRGDLAAGRRGAAMASMLMRASIVLLLGFLLGSLGAPVYVVLHYFGFAMMLAAPLLLAPSWLVGLVAAALAGGGPWLLVAVRSWRWHGDLQAFPGTAPDQLRDNPLAALADLAFTGEYPAITWVAYMAIGMLLARMFLRARGRAGRLLGAALALVGAALTTAALLISEATLSANAVTWATSEGIEPWARSLLLSVGSGGPPGTESWWQWTAIAHTGTLLDIARGVGISAIVIGSLTLALPAGAPAPALVRPMQAAGAASLTIYTAHVAGLAVVYNLAFMASPGINQLTWLTQGVGIWLVHIAVTLLFGVLLAALRARGPLETGVSAMARIAASWVPRR